MATLRSSLPSRLRKLLSGEAAMGPALRLGYSEPMPKITTMGSSTRCPMPQFSFSTRHSRIFIAMSMGYGQHLTTTSRCYSDNAQGSSYKSTPFGFVRVPEKKALIIEERQTFKKILKLPSLHPVNPYVDRVAFVHELRERNVRVEYDAVTVDRYKVSVIAFLRVKTVDVLLAAYTPPNADHITATIELVKKTLEDSLSVRTVENIISDRRTLRHEVWMVITPVLESWGIECRNCTIKYICYKRHTEQKSIGEKLVDFFYVTYIKPMLDLFLWFLNMVSFIIRGFGIGDRGDSSSNGGGKKSNGSNKGGSSSNGGKEN